MLEAGFGREDITPRLGVELSGFGPYLHRYATAIRDRLWARAMAVRAEGATVVLVACDLLGVTGGIVAEVRRRVSEATGVDGSAVMISCSHTHSGPALRQVLTGWGEPDAPYIELLPIRIARAAVAAVADLGPASFTHAAVACEGIGVNRQYDRDAPPLEAVLDDHWRPAKPELTDTTAHVLSVHKGDRLAGFVCSFGCHPVVCSQRSSAIHGDFPGVAVNWLEQEHPGATGLFLQGSLGDVNSCVVHKPDQESLLALNVIAGRFARCVRRGLASAEPLAVDRLAAVDREHRFTRRDFAADQLQRMRAEEQARFEAADACDADIELRMAMVRLNAIRKIEAHLAAGERQFEPPAHLQAIRIGPLCLLGTSLEVFQAIRNDVVAACDAELTLVLSMCNGMSGYATDRATAEAGGYAAEIVPMIMGERPYERIHDELVEALVELNRALLTDPSPSTPGSA